MNFKKVVNLFLFTLILGFGAVSCSDDDDKVSPPDNLVVKGTWKFDKLSSEVEAVDSIFIDSIANYIDTMKVATKRVYVFKLDGTYENNSGEEGAEVVKGEYKVSGNKIILDNKTDAAIAFTFASDTLKATEDVRVRAAEDLEIDLDSITKANKVEIFYRISR